MLRIPSKQGGCRRKIFSCQSPRSSEIMAARSCHNNILGPTVRCAPCSCAAAPWGCEKCATAVRTDVGGKRREGLRKGESSRKRAGIGPQLGHQPHKVDSVRSPSSRSRSSGGKAPPPSSFSPRRTFSCLPLKVNIRKRKYDGTHF